ncbi:hypothetical protein [Micromonospora sp. NPDC023633]|uniref:hypothetical protein n=1 Tax=Micromonospora sp. NPDC023633 TaxID=3154320 RepID=UPI0033F07938
MTPWIAATIAAYALLCAVSPFGKCRRCKGKGHRKTVVRKRPRPCRRCKTTGLRRRYGRSLYVWTKKTYRPLLDEKRRARAGSAA